MLQCCHIALYWEILDQKLPVCRSIVETKNQTVGSPILGAFPSDRNPKKAKNVNANSWDRNFSHAEIPGNFQRIPGNFWSKWLQICHLRCLSLLACCSPILTPTIGVMVPSLCYIIWTVFQIRAVACSRAQLFSSLTYLHKHKPA